MDTHEQARQRLRAKVWGAIVATPDLGDPDTDPAEPTRLRALWHVQRYLDRLAPPTSTPPDKPVWIIPTMPRLLGHLARPDTAQGHAAKYMLSSPPTSRPSKPEPREPECRCSVRVTGETVHHRRCPKAGLSDGEADMLTRVWGGR